MAMQIERYIEHEITSDLHAAIEALRNSCFPEHRQTRSYGKQLPHFRLLAYLNDQLVGHLGIDHRVMRFGDQVCRVFGVIDLCVAEGSRNGGIASGLLSELEKSARAGDIDVLVLMANDHRLYLKHGFVELAATCRWLRIDEHRNLGVVEEEISDELMVKLIGLDAVPEGPIDFLGYLF